MKRRDFLKGLAIGVVTPFGVLGTVNAGSTTRRPEHILPEGRKPYQWVVDKLVKAFPNENIRWDVFDYDNEICIGFRHDHPDGNWQYITSLGRLGTLPYVRGDCQITPHYLDMWIAFHQQVQSRLQSRRVRVPMRP